MKYLKMKKKSLKYLLVILIISAFLFMCRASFGSAVGIVITLMTVYCLYRFDISHKKFLIVLVSISFLIRMVCIFEIHNPQVSDFKTMYEISEDIIDGSGSLNEVSHNYINEWNYQTPFILFQALILFICNKIMFLECVNVAFCILDILLMYRIMSRISNKKCAQIFTTLYALFLNPIFYNNVLSNQHVFLFLTLLAFDLIFEEKIIKNQYLRIILSTIAIAIADLLRPEGTVWVVALAIYLVLSYLFERKNIKSLLIKLLILIIGFLGITKGTMAILKSTSLITQESNVSWTYKFVLGLDYKSTGRWSEEEYNNFFALDKEEQTEYGITKIKQNLFNVNVISLFKNKINLFWNDFANEWALSYLNNVGLKFGAFDISMDMFYDFIYSYDKILWGFVIILAIIGIFNRKDVFEKNIYYIFLLDVAFIYLFIEIQGRYAFTYRPYVFILASVGLKNLFEFLKNKKGIDLEKVKKSEKNIIENREKILKSPIMHITLLIILSGLVNIICLYFSTGNLGNQMFNSYLNNDYIVFLNFLPIIYVAIIFYVLTRKVSLSFAFSSIISYAIVLINLFKMQLRDDNLLMEDVTLIKEALKIQTNYTIEFTSLMVIWIVVFVAISVILYFFFDRREKLEKNEVTKKKVIIKIVARFFEVVVLVVVGFVLIDKVYVSKELYEKTRNEGNYFNRWSTINQYISRGTIYSFLHSYSGMKVIVPEGYNKSEAKKMLEKYQYSNIPEDKKINVIGIMLEAYNDFSKFDEIEFIDDPYKELHEIEKESYSGELVTSIFAGGTVDTERKFLTGYTSLPSLRKKTNSYVRYFKEQGYTVEGSHPSYEWFYNRLNINKNIGFENYYFYENMYAELANNAIATDELFMTQILNLYNIHKSTSDKPYFSFNVTYQNHGPYLDENSDNTKEYIRVKDDYTKAEVAILNNYLTGIADTGKNLKMLTDNLKEDNEPVILIFFGDHNPWLGNDNSVYNMLGINLIWDTEEGATNYYCTPYVIWANDKAKEVLGNDFVGKGERISPNFLMNKLFELAGYDGNEFMKASNELKKNVQAVNQDFYYENNIFVQDLSQESEEMLEEYNKIQYYWTYDAK